MKLPADVLERVLVLGYKNRTLTSGDLHTWVKINRHFEYLVHNLIKRYSVIWKDIRNLLHTYYNHNVSHFIDITYTYPSIFSFSLPNFRALSDSSLSSNFFIELTPENSVDKYTSFLIPRHGDLLKSFSIVGTGINKVTLKIGNTVVFKQHFINAKMVCVKPFDFDIPLIALHYQDVELSIYADTLTAVRPRYKYLHGEKRHQCFNNSFTRDVLFYNDGHLYTTFHISGGILSRFF